MVKHAYWIVVDVNCGIGGLDWEPEMDEVLEARFGCGILSEAELTELNPSSHAAVISTVVSRARIKQPRRIGALHRITI